MVAVWGGGVGGAGGQVLFNHLRLTSEAATQAHWWSKWRLQIFFSHFSRSPNDTQKCESVSFCSFRMFSSFAPRACLRVLLLLAFLKSLLKGSALPTPSGKPSLPTVPCQPSALLCLQNTGFYLELSYLWVCLLVIVSLPEGTLREGRDFVWDPWHLTDTQ